LIYSFLDELEISTNFFSSVLIFSIDLGVLITFSRVFMSNLLHHNKNLIVHQLLLIHIEIFFLIFIQLRILKI